MTEGVESDLSAIDAVRAATLHFATAVQDRLDVADPEATRVIALLDDRRDSLKREASALRGQLSSVDDDEESRAQRSFLEDRLETLERDCVRVKKASDRLQENYVACRQAARKLLHSVTDDAVAARLFLDNAAADLAQYLALNVEGGGIPISDSGSFSPFNNSRHTSESSPSTFDPTSQILPPGFTWIRIQDIDQASTISGFDQPINFEKVSREEMQHGFDLLKSEILPALASQSTSIGGDYFALQDRTAKRSFEQGAQRAYEAFFGLEPIYVTRPVSEEKWLVTNGRHRILTASNLGWTAVPARTGDDRR